MPPIRPSAQRVPSRDIRTGGGGIENTCLPKSACAQNVNIRLLLGDSRVFLLVSLEVNRGVSEEPLYRSFFNKNIDRTSNVVAFGCGS